MASSQDKVPNQVEDRSESSQVPDQEHDQVPVKSRKSSPTSDAGKITKPKTPGRVAAGKRLAEMNRKNKAMKNAPSDPEPTFKINWQYILTGGGLVIGVVGLYYAYKEHQRAVAASAPRMINPLPVSTNSKLHEME